MAVLLFVLFQLSFFVCGAIHTLRDHVKPLAVPQSLTSAIETSYQCGSLALQGQSCAPIVELKITLFGIQDG